MYHTGLHQGCFREETLRVVCHGYELTIPSKRKLCVPFVMDMGSPITFQEVESFFCTLYVMGVNTLMLFWDSCEKTMGVGHIVFRSFIWIFFIIYPLSVRVVGTLQMISQPVSSIFPSSPLPSGTWRTPGLSITWCCWILFRTFYWRLSCSLCVTSDILLECMIVFCGYCISM